MERMKKLIFKLHLRKLSIMRSWKDWVIPMNTMTKIRVRRSEFYLFSVVVRILLSATVSRPTLGPTQPPIKWLSGDRYVKLGIHFHLVPSLRMRGDIPSLPHTYL
jgi:hypothetical protein